METKNIIVLGGDSMIGLSLEKILNIYRYENLNSKNFIFHFIKKKELDVRNYNSLDIFLEKFIDIAEHTIVVNLLQHRGGLVKNINNTLEMYIENQEINHNLLTLCYKYNIYRVINILSTSLFGDESGFPVKEEYLDEGAPHFSNLGYAQANKNAQVLSDLINLDKYYKYVNLITTDVYGEFDNYNIEDGTVIPGIINRIYKAINSGEKKVNLLGNGESERMFIYVDDLSRVILDFIFSIKNRGNYIVSGSLRKKIKIVDLAILIQDKYIELGLGEDIELIFDKKNEFNGQLVRTCSNDELKKVYRDCDIEYPVKDKLEKNIGKIVEWFTNNNKNYSNK